MNEYNIAYHCTITVTNTTLYIFNLGQSSLYTAYTKTTSVYIDTLRELDSSGLTITSTSPPLRNTFGNWQTYSKVLRSLKGKILLEYSDNGTLDRVAEYRDVCSIERYSDVHILIKVF